MSDHLFVAGVPAAGKSRLGQWLSDTQGFVHIDAEKDAGRDFDRAGVHEEWDKLIATGRATDFLAATEELSRPLVIDWGFPVRYMYVACALRAEGFNLWWLHADRAQARELFIARGGIELICFERQMDDIAREWSLVESVFDDHIVLGIGADGIPREPRDIWADIAKIE